MSRVTRQARSSRSSSSSLAGGRRSKSSLATMTWQVEQAICPFAAPSSGWPSRLRQVEQVGAGRRLDLMVERSVGLQKPHLDHAGSTLCCVAPLRRSGGRRDGQLLLAGIAAEAEADRRARLAVGQADRAQHMARPARAAGAGRAQREGDVAHVGDQPRTVEAVAADVEIAVIALVGAAVDRPSWSECCERNLHNLSTCSASASRPL